jgi:hypothetical protein
MENIDIFYGRSEYITAIWYILWPLGNLVAVWYSFPRFGILCQEKSGNPALACGEKGDQIGRLFTFGRFFGYSLPRYKSYT